MTPSRFLRGWKGYSRIAALCHSMGGLPQLGVAGQTQDGCRSTIEPRFTTTLDEGNASQARKGGGPGTTLLRDHGKETTTRRKRIRSKVCLVSRLSGNLMTSAYLDPGSLPSLSSPRPTAFAGRYTCPRSSGGAAVVTGRSVEVVVVGVASNVVRAPSGWSWAAPFVHGTHGRT